MPTVPAAVYSYPYEDWSLLQLIVRGWYRACEHHFETQFRGHQNILAGWHTVGKFSNMPADRGGFDSLLPL